MEKVRDCYLYQHVSKPTRARIDHEPHVLDLLLSNEDGMISDITVSVNIRYFHRFHYYSYIYNQQGVRLLPLI
jgi:hypothetical protein